MGSQFYELVGGVNENDRIDRVQVETASEDHPQGKFLRTADSSLPGDTMVELTDDQVSRLAPYVSLRKVEDPGADAASTLIVQQPGVPSESHSTDVPPKLGAIPHFDAMNFEDLRKLAGEREIEGRGGKSADELREMLANDYAEKGE